MSKILICLHGLGSKGKTSKSDALRSVLEPLGITVLTPDLPNDPAEVSIMIKNLVENLDIENLVFCGTSLGGFYSSYFGEIFDAPYVIANPVISPSTAFTKYLNNPPISWVTKAPINIKQSDLDVFDSMEFQISNPTGVLANVFLAKDDEVVPYKPVAERFKFAATLQITDTGGHRYEENWDEVIKCVTSIFKVSKSDSTLV